MGVNQYEIIVEAFRAEEAVKNVRSKDGILVEANIQEEQKSCVETKGGQNGNREWRHEWRPFRKTEVTKEND